MRERRGGQEILQPSSPNHLVLQIRLCGDMDEPIMVQSVFGWEAPFVPLLWIRVKAPGGDAVGIHAGGSSDQLASEESPLVVFARKRPLSPIGVCDWLGSLLDRRSFLTFE